MFEPDQTTPLQPTVDLDADEPSGPAGGGAPVAGPAVGRPVNNAASQATKQESPLATARPVSQPGAPAGQPEKTPEENAGGENEPPRRRIQSESHKSLVSVEEIERVLSMGEAMLIQGKLRSQPYKSILAGWIPGECIILAPSLAVLAAGQIVKEELLQVRYLLLGKVYGFETTVTRITLNPPLVIVEWPDEMEVASVSREVRQSANIPVVIVFYNETGQQILGSANATMTELSEGGCRLKTLWQNEVMENYLPGSKVRVETGLGLASAPLTLNYIVRNFSRQGNYAVLGLQLAEESCSDKDQICSILKMQLHR